MKIINCDDAVIEKIPNIMELVYQLFGEKDVTVFATLDEKDLGFIVRAEERCVFINNKGEYTLFTVDENDDLYAVGKKDYTVVFSDSLCFVSQDKESSLAIKPLAKPDEDDYDGMVRFLQYDKKNDVMCEIDYQQMYREHNGFAPIYSFHTKRIDRVYIDEKFEKKKERPGLLPRRAKYFSKMMFKEGELGYDICALKEFGLVEFLSKGPYQLVRDNEIVRYSKTYAIDFSGVYRDPWPFGKDYTEDDIKALIQQFGFESEIPEEFLTIYNGGDRTIQTIKEVVGLMKEVQPLLEKPENNRMCLILRAEK